MVSDATRDQKIIVIGAGISGLACAYGLKQSGHDVTVIEAASRVGGVIQSRIEDGFLCETGPNSFQDTSELISLVREIGLEDELIAAPSHLPRYIFYQGRLHRAPMGPAAFFSTRLLNASDKIRILRELWMKPNARGSDESLAGFVTRHLGPQVLRNLVAPFISGVYAGDPSRLSARSVFPSLVDFEKTRGSVLKGFLLAGKKPARAPRPRRLCTFRKGLHTLPLRISEKIGTDRIVLNTAIREIRAMPTGAPRRFIVRAGATLEFTAETLVLATPASVAAEVLAPFSQTLARELASIEYPPLAGLCVGYARSEVPHPLDGFGFLAPRGEGIRILGCVWNSTVFPERAPQGSVLLTVFVGGATDTAVESLTDGELIEVTRRDLDTTLRIAAAPRLVAIHRYRHSIPQYTIGHEERLQRIEEELRKFPGIYLIGNYQRGVSVGDCVKQATQLASRVTKTTASPYE